MNHWKLNRQVKFTDILQNGLECSTNSDTRFKVAEHGSVYIWKDIMHIQHTSSSSRQPGKINSNVRHFGWWIAPCTSFEQIINFLMPSSLLIMTHSDQYKNLLISTQLYWYELISMDVTGVNITGRRMGGDKKFLSLDFKNSTKLPKNITY